MIPTIQDIARKANAADTAVAVASTETTNCTPNVAARNLRRGRTTTIGRPVNDMTNLFCALMAWMAEKCATRRGCRAFVSD